MNWRVVWVSLLIALLFGIFGWAYFRFYVSPKKHGIVLLIIPGIEPDRFVEEELPNLLSATRTSFVANPPDYPQLMTQLASGLKRDETLPNQIGVDKDGTPMDTLLYQAQKRGRVVGVTSTVSMVSPGISAFFAHQTDAEKFSDIALQLLDSTRINLIFVPDNGMFQLAKKEHERDLLKEVELYDYQILHSAEAVETFPAWMPRNVFGLFEEMPPLANLVRRAIQKLQYHIGGYFFVVESSAEDFGQLDRVIQSILEYGGKNTMLVVYSPNLERKTGWVLLHGGEIPPVLALLRPEELHRLILHEL